MIPEVKSLRSKAFFPRSEAMPQKPTKTALWARRIFSAPMSAKTAGCNFAKGFRRFAKGNSLTAGYRVASGEWPDEKQPSSVVSHLSSSLRLRWYSLRLRFKRCQMPSSRHSTPATRHWKSLRDFIPNKPNRSGFSFCKPARMCS